MDDQWEMFSDVVRSMSDSDTTAGSMEAAIAGVAGIIPNAQHAGVSMVRKDRGVETIAASDDLVRRGDALQYELSDGPCLQAIWQMETVQSNDLTTEERWPVWSRRAAAELGVRSMLCLQLFVTEDTLGCLNIYSERVDGFDEHDRVTALAMAAHIAVALSSAHEIHDLESSVVNRTVIGQAQGMLMQRYEMEASAAFDVLARVAQHENRRLHEISKELVARGLRTRRID
jgi:transcriptional regulator with GAF, ATPase, and Fis domain